MKKATRLALLAVLISLAAVSGFAETKAGGLAIVPMDSGPTNSSPGPTNGSPGPVTTLMTLIAFLSSIMVP